MIQLSPITPHDLVPADVELLARVGTRAYDNAEASFFVQKSLDGDLKFYRLSGDVWGLVGLEKHVKSAGLELWVSFIAGENATKFLQEIWQELLKVKEEVGAKTIATMAPSPALARIYQRQLGLVPKAYLFVEE